MSWPPPSSVTRPAGSGAVAPYAAIAAAGVSWTDRHDAMASTKSGTNQGCGRRTGTIRFGLP